MIYWVYQNALNAGLDEVYVATDHDEIRRAVEAFGGRAVLTSAEHASGTARVAELARTLDVPYFLNIQGDEPQMAPEVIRAVAAALCRGDAPVVSAMVRLCDAESYRSTAVVKVVTDRYGGALYFSRAPIPYYRDSDGVACFKHLGIYGYTRDCLLGLPTLPASWLEDAERLEQLRFLESGVQIRMIEVAHDSVGVDTEEDLQRVRRVFEAHGAGAAAWRATALRQAGCREQRQEV